MIKTGKKLGSISRIFLIVLISLVLILPVFVETVVAQAPSNYFVTVNPITSNNPMYTPVGSNWTLSFQAIWSYGNNSGQPIRNATVEVKVSGSRSGAITSLNLNTTSGVFSFNYSSSIAEIITFTPIKLTTQEGVDWNSTLSNISGSQVFGFQSKSVTVWWDTFQVALTDSNTGTIDATDVSVNVTYLLLPEEGLTLPAENTYSNQTFLSKIVHGANVTINGVEAKETSIAGIYKANVPTIFPTAYIIVAVSQEGWVKTTTGFSFNHNANEPLWEIAVAIGLALVAVALTYFLVLKRKSKGNFLSQKKRLAFFGGVLLVITSVISLYWGLVGLDSTLHGFDWILLTLIGLLTFGSGLVASISAMRRRNQALVIFAVLAPMFTNLVGVKYSLDLYHLATPWLILLASLALSIISGVLISNADEAFDQPKNSVTQTLTSV